MPHQEVDLASADSHVTEKMVWQGLQPPFVTTLRKPSLQHSEWMPSE
jgi:hypothetical protein